MIGVFDSGSGGLTVMRALERELAYESFVYLGDHANAPYGNRQPAEIYDFTRHGVERLFRLGCGLVIVACNTAVATGLRRLQTTWLPGSHPSRRVLGVFVPLIEAITGVPWTRDARLPPAGIPARPLHVAVFATRHTVRTRAYVDEIQARAPGMRVSQQACPELAGMIDAGVAEDAIRRAVRGHIAELLETAGATPDVCILGCTHYPLVQHIFVDELPRGVRLLSQPDATAASLRRYLARHPAFSAGVASPTVYLTTGDADHVSALASRYYGRAVRFRTAPTAPSD
ncbi:glutamate racemase [Bordetella bronchialis]|uniref:Glutamate racemase n=1 Tax=Bordetella bronchialis TaxID=463025 RepID=A0A193G4F3_9BORD|nr:aspartate/glutamate racemase family protein [Bordetella bronchialis]ANN74331.1 glutamate racemase [Bordetella bronchialis]